MEENSEKWRKLEGNLEVNRDMQSHRPMKLHEERYLVEIKDKGVNGGKMDRNG